MPSGGLKRRDRTVFSSYTLSAWNSGLLAVLHRIICRGALQRKGLRMKRILI